MKSKAIETAVAAALLLMALVLVARLVLLVDKGFDFSDDGYNILTAMYPAEMFAFISVAPFLTEWLWAFAGQDIGIFRLVGILLLAAASMLLSFLVYAHGRRTRDIAPGFVPPLLFAAVSLIGIIFYYRQFYTLAPSYNSVSLTGMMIFLAGMLCVQRSRQNIGAIALVAFGLAFVFIGKPPSFAAIFVAALSLCFLFGAPRHYLRALLLGVSCGGGMVALFLQVQVGGIDLFLARAAAGFDTLADAGTGHSVVGGVQKLLKAATLTTAKVFLFTQKISMAVMTCLAVLIWWFRLRLPFAFAICLVIAAYEISTHDVSHGLYNAYLATSYFLTIIYGAAVFGLANTIGRGPVDIRRILAAGFVVLLCAAAVVSQVAGTNRDPGEKMLLAIAAILPVSVWIAFCTETHFGQRAVAVTVTAATVLAGTVLFERSAETPFRIVGPISEQTVPVTFQGQSRPLYVDPGRAAYVTGVLREAREAGWRPGTHLLNLSGNMPGVNVVLDAPFVGLPWFFATSGGQALLERVLQQEDPETVESMWILLSVNGRSRLVLDRIDLRGGAFPCGYSRVGRFEFDAALHYRNGPVETHELWRPEENLSDCR